MIDPTVPDGDLYTANWTNKVLSRISATTRQALAQGVPGVERVHSGGEPPSIDLVIIPNTLAPPLEFAFNDPSIFRVIEQITGCPPIARFGGFVYRLSPLHGHRHH